MLLYFFKLKFSYWTTKQTQDQFCFGSVVWSVIQVSQRNYVFPSRQKIRWEIVQRWKLFRFLRIIHTQTEWLNALHSLHTPHNLHSDYSLHTLHFLHFLHSLHTLRTLHTHTRQWNCQNYQFYHHQNQVFYNWKDQQYKVLCPPRNRLSGWAQ